jgi:His-Xaa-Ser system radical SAM maturase HxsC
MCSQPPLDYDDTEDNIKAWLYAIELMPKDVNQIGITGGEPTLLGEGLVLIVNKLQKKYPTIIIDILSNGRLQAKDGTIDILSKITNPSNVIFAIPLYSDIYKEHDYIVQAKDAFHQTCLGIHKMASVGFMIEIRVVLHKLSIKRLYNLSKFIHFNFPFSYHITFMGLEIIGYTKANKELLLIDDQDTYISKIKQSLEFLDKWKYKTSIYNTPFCQLPKNLWDYSRQSISDWKNSFHDECDSCVMKKDCAGFFSWNLKYSKVYPITSLDE